MVRGKTKREIDAEHKEFMNPTPISIDDALASESPVYEIHRRLVKSRDGKPLTEAEYTFSASCHVQGDTLNGGFHQCLSNSTGELIPVALELAKNYGDEKIVAIFEEVIALFPNSQVPSNREARNELLDEIIDYEHFDPETDTDPFEELDRRFYDCYEAYETGLLRFAQEHKEQFVHFKRDNADA